MATYYLAHHGIKEQRWGIRRYQNKDGSLTPEGKERYRKNTKKELKSNTMKFNDSFNDWGKSRSKNVLYLEDRGSYLGDRSSSDSFVNEMKKQGRVNTVDLTKYKSFSWVSERKASNDTRTDVINRKIKDGTFDKDLVDILEKKATGWDSLHGAKTLSDSKIPLANGVTTRGEILNKIGNAVTEYGAKKYDQGSRVIVTDSELFKLHSPDFYKSNPVCIVGGTTAKKDKFGQSLTDFYSEMSNSTNEESFYKRFNTKRKVKDL